ncbi:MAG: DUF3592 domain-containing protein [Ruminococcus sp.]|nr:DUF3592 domain-containing protein [Ruminococcus sp.]
MNVEKIDYIWAIVSFITVGVTYHYGYLLYGLLGIYVLMVAVFLYHIFKVKKRIRNTVAVYGRITDYHTEKGTRIHYYPIVRYETEDGTEISSAYTIADKEKKYDIGDEEMICYDPYDELFFYFANRESELTTNYYRYIIFGGIAAIFVLIAILAY